MTADLHLEDIGVRFGGLVAVDQLTLHAPAAAITALIGPNGAGKTTTFNATTGSVSATGTVHLGERRLDGLGPAARAQLGLGRTFQRIELFDTMTARANVAMGPEMYVAGSRRLSHLIGSRRHLADARSAADDALDRCGITHLADRPASALATGERRLLELARAMATPFDFLLLDEPSSGLDVGETEAFASILQGIVDRDGTGILLVEHDMALVRSVCSHAYVLDFGRLLSEGPLAEVLASDVVRAAYLGSEAVEEATSGEEVVRARA